MKTFNFSLNAVKTVIWGLLVSLGLLTLLSAPAMGATIGGRQILAGFWRGQPLEYVEGEILVGLAEGVTPAAAANLLAQQQLKTVNNFDHLNIGLLQAAPGRDLFQIIETLNRHPLIRYAEPNGILYATQLEPNDPYYLGSSPAGYAHQWALKNTGQTPPHGSSNADIDGPEAWAQETGNAGVLIAVLDTGIPMLNGQLSHPDLNDPNKFLLGPDFIDKFPGDITVRDERGHGTHVTGILAAETNNGEGVAGVCWNCRVYVIQVVDKNNMSTFSAIGNGIMNAVDNGAEIISMSVGGGYSSCMEDGVKYANAHGVLQVYPSGNSGLGYVDYPAAHAFKGTYSGFENGYPTVMSVAATDPNDQKPSYSSYSQNQILVSVAAPGGYGGAAYDGDDIFSTMPNYPVVLNSEGISQMYGYMAGTSMAVPHVSGLAGLLLSRNPTYTATQIKHVIEQTADDVNRTADPGQDEKIGWGRINAFQALTWCGTLGANTLWSTEIDLASDKIRVCGDVTVPAGVTLTIDARVDIPANVKLTIASGAHLEIKSDAQIHLLGGSDIFVYGTMNNYGEIHCENGSEVAVQGGGVCYNFGTIHVECNDACIIVNPGGFLCLPRGVVQTVTNGGLMINNGGTIELQDNAQLVFDATSQKLEAKPGSVFKLGANAKITVNSKLLADGAAGPITFTSLYSNPAASQYWQGLELNGSTNDAGVLRNITLQYSQDGLKLINCKPLVETCVFSNNSNQGMYLENSYATLRFNGFSANPVNIAMSASSPYLYGNNIANTGTGIKVDNYSLARLGTGSTPGRNEINGGATGISVSKYSQVDGGSGSNCVYGQSVYNLSVTDHSSANLKSTFWGSNPRYYKDATSSYVIGYPMTYCAAVRLFPPDSTVTPEPETPLTAAQELYGLAMTALYAGDLSEAVRLFRQVIQRFPQDFFAAHALVSLAHIHREHGLPGFSGYLTGLLRNPQHADLQPIITDLLNWDASGAAAAMTAGVEAAVMSAPKDETAQGLTFKLEQAYPNPFAASTTIAYALPQAGPVRLAVYNAAGQLVRALADGEESAGHKSVTWDGVTVTGERAPNGVYLYRLEANGFSETKRMALLR